MTNSEKFKEVFGFGADGSRVIAVNSTWRDCEFQNSKPITKRVPAADLRPVVRGKWLNDFCGKGRFSKRIVQCSLCGNYLDMDGVNGGRGDANYCPNCGADMREPPKEDAI